MSEPSPWSIVSSSSCKQTKTHSRARCVFPRIRRRSVTALDHSLGLRLSCCSGFLRSSGTDHSTPDKSSFLFVSPSPSNRRFTKTITLVNSIWRNQVSLMTSYMFFVRASVNHTLFPFTQLMDEQRMLSAWEYYTEWILLFIPLQKHRLFGNVWVFPPWQRSATGYR